jgi:hypothetical protein
MIWAMHRKAPKCVLFIIMPALAEYCMDGGNAFLSSAQMRPIRLGGVCDARKPGRSILVFSQHPPRTAQVKNGIVRLVYENGGDCDRIQGGKMSTLVTFFCKPGVKACPWGTPYLSVAFA